MNALIPVMLVGSLLVISGGANADDKSDIAALYQSLQSAMKAQSDTLVLALLAPNFSYKTRKGEVLNGEKFVAQMKEQQKDVIAIKEMTMTITKTVLTGRTAKVTNKYAWAMEIEDTAGQMGVKGAHHIMRSTGTTDNNLEKTAAGWRFLTLNTADGKMTMDGKSMMRRTPPSGTSKPAAK